jgi:hypothetical protein
VAELVVDGDHLVVQMTFGEKFWSFHGDVRVPLSGVYRVKAVTKVWMDLRGWRMAGFSYPGKAALGTRRHGDGYDFVAVHGMQPAVQVDIHGPPRWQRLVISVAKGADVQAEAERVAAAAGIAVS